MKIRFLKLLCRLGIKHSPLSFYKEGVGLVGRECGFCGVAV